MGAELAYVKGDDVTNDQKSRLAYLTRYWDELPDFYEEGGRGAKGFFKNKNRPGYNTLGASGGVSAMVFASIIYAPLNKICLFAILCFPGFILGVIFLIYSFTQGENLSQNNNHEAHLYGALYGIFFSIWVYPESAVFFLEKILIYSPF